METDNSVHVDWTSSIYDNPWYVDGNNGVRSTMDDTIVCPSPPVFPPTSSKDSPLESVIEVLLQLGIHSITRSIATRCDLSTRTTGTPQSSSIVLTPSVPFSVSKPTLLTVLTLYRTPCTTQCCNRFGHLWWRITSCTRHILWWERCIGLCITVRRLVWHPLDLALLPMASMLVAWRPCSWYLVLQEEWHDRKDNCIACDTCPLYAGVTGLPVCPDTRCFIFVFKTCCGFFIKIFYQALPDQIIRT